MSEGGGDLEQAPMELDSGLSTFTLCPVFGSQAASKKLFRRLTKLAREKMDEAEVA